jgi:hypothetical protein
VSGCRRCYTAKPAPVPDATVPRRVASPSEATAHPTRYAARSVPFWEQPAGDGGGGAPHPAWTVFQGRAEAKTIAELWDAGVRWLPGRPGVPLRGVPEADRAAARCGRPTAGAGGTRRHAMLVSLLAHSVNTRGCFFMYRRLTPH